MDMDMDWKNWDVPLGPNMSHETIAALRAEGGWRMEVLACPPEEAAKRLAAQGISAADCRIVSYCHAGQGHEGVYMAHHAHREGWQRHKGTGLWYPIEEPLPLLPGQPVPCNVDVRMDRIIFGSIRLLITADGKTIASYIDDMGDSLNLLIRFTRSLKKGDFPHATLSDRASTLFIVQEMGGPDLCRLIIRGKRDDGGDIDIDCVVERHRLIETFAGLATAIADHPHLAHGFLLFAEFDGQTEPVLERAEAIWQAGVEEGRYPSDDPDAADAFGLQCLAAEVPLTAEQQEYVDRWRLALKTLETVG